LRLGYLSQIPTHPHHSAALRRTIRKQVFGPWILARRDGMANEKGGSVAPRPLVIGGLEVIFT
jgi:hypothetical protein